MKKVRLCSGFWIPVRFISSQRTKMVFIKGENQALKNERGKKNNNNNNYENTE